MADARASLRGDLFGGVTAAIIALPLAVAFGVAVVAPLGAEHAPTGALVGLLGAIFTGFFAALLGGTPAQITGPTGPMTVVTTSFIAASFAGRSTESVPLVLALTGFTVALGGIVQVVIGATGGGKIVKFIPYPVVAGFMNGIAVIIFLGQIKPFLGVSGALSTFDPASAWVPIGIGGMTIAAILVTRRASKIIPASLVGLLVGIAVYLAFAAAGKAPFRATENPLLVGPIASPFSSFEQVKKIVPLFQVGVLGGVSAADLQRVVTSALTLGVLGSIDSLLTSVVADSITHTRHDSRRELFGQGIGNMVSGLFGGIAGAGATVRTLVNINAGGRSRRSGMFHSIVILVVVAALGKPAGWIPMSALAGILFVTAVGMIDTYSLQLVRRRRVRSEFLVMLVVTVVTVAVDLMIAVGIGVAIAGILFISQQAKQGVVRRRLRGHEVTSRRNRRPEELDILHMHAAGTVAYQLGGSLFFGTTDTLASELENDTGASERVIFDFARVRDMDLSGAQLLLSIVDRLREQGKSVRLSGLGIVVASCPGLHEILVEMGILEKVGPEHLHDTFDRALEACENEVIEKHGVRLSHHVVDLRGYDGFSELSKEEAEELTHLLLTKDLVVDEVLFAEATPADQLVLVRRGHLAVVHKTPQGEARIATLGPGEIWDERVLVDDARWQSSLRAETASSVYLLPRAAIQRMRQERATTYDHLVGALLRSAVARGDALKAEFVLLEES